jgi:hypothetical protein
LEHDDARHLFWDETETGRVYQDPNSCGADWRRRLDPGLRHRHLGHAIRSHGGGVCAAGNLRRLRGDYWMAVPQGEAFAAAGHILCGDCGRCCVLGFIA